MRALPLFCAVFVLVGCGGEAPPPVAPKAAVEASPPPAEPGPKDSVSRASVDAALKAGLGRFLSNLDVEPALEGKKKFIGWRIVELRGAMWTGVDLHPGDVVTSVNGFKIERESEANKAFQSLEVASEIRVSVLRDGKPIELRFSIVDEK
ncbi:MAG: PDZ domain-containing protein [Polyangiales bacterium]